MPADLRLTNGVLSVSLTPQGAALTDGQTADGRAFLRASTGRAVTDHACFPMVPLCNRLGGNRFAFAGRDHTLDPNTDDPLYLHGDGWLTEWQVRDTGIDHATLTMAHDKGPFCYGAQQSVGLDGTTVHLRLTVQNRGSDPMPFGIGFHPYFPRDKALLNFTASARWMEDAEHLPTSRHAVPADADFSTPRPLPQSWQNNAYDGWSGRARIEWPDQRLCLDLRADAVFGTVMLYAPDHDRSFFCLEPMSHLPNALNMPGHPGLHVLARGEALSGAISMTVTTTEPPP